MSGSSGVADRTLTNIEKNMWHIHIKPLPDIIRTNPDVIEDVIACAANTALMTRPTYSLRSAASDD